jgi:TPR repeat protein
MPAVPNAASKKLAKPVKPKRPSVPAKKHASPPVERSGASIRPPTEETDAGANVSQFLETIKSASGIGNQQNATPIVGSMSAILPSPPEKLNGKTVQNPEPGSSRSFRLAEATSVTDISRGRSKTEELAILQRAALGGDPQAELLLAVHYAFGEGVRQDYFEALKWFTQAAAQGVTPSRGRAADALKRTNRWLAGHEKELAQNH